MPNLKQQIGYRFQIPIVQWLNQTWSWRAMSRGLALFLGAFSLLNLAGGFRRSGFDANLWWIDLRWMPEILRVLFMLISSLCLLGFAIRPACCLWRKALTASCAGLLGIFALQNAGQYYFLIARRSIQTAIPVPLSIFIAAALGLILVTCIRSEQGQSGHRGFLLSCAICAACMCLFPLAQMFSFGKTDYSRPADVAVVLGARVYADGRPSDALADRVRTACQLYRNGIVKKLLFSGGPGDGDIHETEGMKQMELGLGVNPHDILVDEAGLNTQATVKHTEAICSRLHLARALVVSHFYHLPRIKLAYQRDGWNVFTVPAKETYLLRQMPFNTAREVAAFWLYYFRPLI